MNDKLDCAWRAVNIYYYEKNKDDLILDCPGPLIEDLTFVHGTVAFFDRHWRCGPHIRLAMRAPLDHYESVVLPLVENRVGTYLQQHPSTRLLTNADAKRMSDRLALYELGDQQFYPLKADNTIERTTYARNELLLRGTSGVSFAEDYAVAVMPVIYTIIAQSRNDRPKRMEISLRLVLAYARTLGDLTRGYMFTRSYLEKIIAHSADPPSARAGFAEAYRKRRARLQTLVHDAETGSCEADPAVLAWMRVYKVFSERITNLLKSAEIVPLAEADADQLVKPYLVAFGKQTTPFLTTLFQNETIRTKMRLDVRYPAHFFIVNCLYKTLAMAGITGAEKIALLSFVAQAVEDVYGISPIDQIANTA